MFEMNVLSLCTFTASSLELNSRVFVVDVKHLQHVSPHGCYTLSETVFLPSFSLYDQRNSIRLIFLGEESINTDCYPLFSYLISLYSGCKMVFTDISGAVVQFRPPPGCLEVSGHD